jgi:hypothetical protein
MGTIPGLHLLTNGAEEMNYEVQTYDTTDNTVYYETVEDAVSCEDAFIVITKKYPNRKVISVQNKKKTND